MQVMSVNVGLPREVEWNGRRIRTGIFKEPVEGAVSLHGHNLPGDGQADLLVHGGPTKAVYAYSAEHYAFWRREFPDRDLPYGMFGENLTLRDADEGSVHVGDRFRIGTAELVVTEPRMPCYKLGIRFGRMDIVKRFLDSRLSGFYLSIALPGVVRAGDAAERIAADPGQVPIREVVRLFVEGAESREDLELMRRALATEALPGMWRRAFAERLAQY